VRKRLFVLVGAAALVAGLTAVPAVTAGAAPRAATVYHPPVAGSSRAVCKTSYSPKWSGCFALVHTNADGRAVTFNSPVGYGPSQIHSAYSLPTTTAGNNTIAVVDAGSLPDIANDIATYDSTFGLGNFPECTSAKQFDCWAELNQNGKPQPLPAPVAGWPLEESLDVEMAHATCQNCRVVLMAANSENDPDLATAVDSAARLHANEISNSYGDYGYDCTQSEDPGYNHPHIAITVSAGDSGHALSCPAVLSSVVSVGGTSLFLTNSGQYSSESVWSGTGGGCSTANQAPPWQKSATNWSTIGCGTGRGMNDVSADSNPSTGVAVYDQYDYNGWVQVGGTSVASPMLAGVYALAGNAATVAYPSKLAYENPSAFHDVTAGSNGSCGVQCNALTGYDLPTGIGSPDGLGGF